MDPIIDNEWLGCKNEPIEEVQSVGNVTRSWHFREQGIDPLQGPSNKTVLENTAEDILVQKPLNIRSCDLPGYPRSTFLMVFSPDGTKVASTHGNHNVYVSELATGKHVKILKGHPRTPWCIAFHPSHPQLIGSGCLGGQVRVWDISSGGSEVWNVRNETVIASIAFHPREQLLVIATSNELYFWDWSQPAPFTRVSTNNVNEKVRYVAFDALGYKLITGISLWPAGVTGNSMLPQNVVMGPTVVPGSRSRLDPSDGPGGGRPQESPGTAQDMIVNSYQNLVQRYDSLVRNYQRLFMVRHRLTNTPPPPNTIDRGTDPMETDLSPTAWTRNARPSTSAANDDAQPAASTSGRQDSAEIGDGESNSSRLLNLDVLSFDSNPRNQSRQDPPQQDFSIFGSRTSAFQPLIDRSGRSFRTIDQNERTTRLLPNPFSSRGGASRTNRVTFTDGPQSSSSNANSSRTSIFTSSFQSFAQRRRNSSLVAHMSNAVQSESASTSSDASSTTTWRVTTLRPATPPFESGPSTSGGNTAQRPTMTNSSTQMSPVTAPVDAQAINESLDLIRDILRDSGTRLLNLITSMSLSTLASVERSMPRRGAASRAHSDDSEGTNRARTRPRVRLFSLRRDFISSSSDSDSDQSLEVNIFRTRNSTYREDNSRNSARSADTASNERVAALVASRMTFELDADSRNETPAQDNGGINVSSTNSRFRVRTQASTPAENNSVPAREASQPENRGQSRSTTREASQPENRGQSSSTTIEASQPENRGQSSSTTREASQPENRGQSSSTTREASQPENRGQSSSTTREASQSENRGQSSSTTREASPPENRGQSSSTTREASQPENRGESSSTDFNANRPSTSRDNFWTRGCVVPPDEAYRKVRSGVNALQKHTILLTNIWLRGSRTTMRELRTMWENLRRRILILHRETGRQDLPSYYTRSLLERCMFLSEMSDNISRSSSRTARPTQRHDESRNQFERRDAPTNPEASNVTQGEHNTPTESNVDTRQTGARRPTTGRVSSMRVTQAIRRRLQACYRWRPDDETRRRTRNPNTNRLVHRYLHNRSRRDFARSIEISATRHEIRMRAMQVLSVMFNMMMMCLEERGLSQLIINMLRTLKKALALTCLMLMTNRNNPRSGSNPGPTGQRVDSLNVVRIQNVDHSGPVNVDGPDEVMSPSNMTLPGEMNSEANRTQTDIQNVSDEVPAAETALPRTSQCVAKEENRTQDYSPPSLSAAAQRWSNRLAVQIAAANRNNSATARNRRDLYMESRRLKALHRTNPSAHPITKKRIFPPISSHRIPSLRFLPSRVIPAGMVTPKNRPPNDEPVAGPSNAPPAASPGQESPRSEVMTEFEQRVHLIRLAHMQALRLRTAARNRFRRLQTIRLYSPSSVREMFALQSNNADNQPGIRSPLQNGSELGNRRPFATYRPHVLPARSEPVAPEDAGAHHPVLSSASVPLLQAGDLSASAEAPSPSPQRLPRIHEYLQPIILAQNAMAVEEENAGDGPGGGAPGAGVRRLSGMAGLLDAGIISEALPAPSHRVQAWDFTTGDTPDIADSGKNVVVQRCRIHNDASIDISKDGRLLVALLPVPRLRNTNHWLGVYSLEWARLGQCLHTAVLEQSAVSVALSPTARHLAVGLGSRRFTTLPHARNNVFALLYRLEPRDSASRTGLSPIKELEQNWEQGFTSLNCLRWAPQPGQGLVYANNTGQLIIMS